MTKQLEVISAVLELVAGALPGVEVLGLNGDDAVPDRVTSRGRAVLRAGDPGKPDIEFSPLTYNYAHLMKVELTALPIDASDTAPALTAIEALDAMLDSLGDAIAADRFLGGLVDFLDAASPSTEDEIVDGAVVARIADVDLTALYSTTKPL